MHYVYLTNNVVTDQAQVDPYTVFNAEYASQFIESPDEVTFDWTLVNGEWVAPVVPPSPTPEEIQQQINKQQASQLLSATDWTTIPDVANPSASNPYLMNQGAFISWRSQVRAIAVNPPTTPAVFPEQPTEQWSN